MSLPCNLHDETYFKTCSLVGAAEQVYNVKSLVAELFNCLFAKLVPYFCGDRLVVILIFFGGPPYGVFCNLVFYEIFVFGRTTCVNACEYVYCSEVGCDTFFITLEVGVGLILVKLFIRGIVNDVLHIFDPILGQIQCCHKLNNIYLGFI